MNKSIYDLYKEQLETPWDKPWEPKKTVKEDYSSELLSMLSVPEGEILITVVGIAKFFGRKPFETGKKVYLIKDPDNKYDSNAIGVFCDDFGKCGYVANSPETVKQGTFSADIIHGGIGDGCIAEVLWADDTFVICKLDAIDNCSFVFNHAVDYCYDNAYDIALKLFCGVEGIRKTVEVLQRICDCYIKLERYENAMEYAEKALVMDNDNNRTKLMKSVILDNLKGDKHVQL